MCVCVGGGGECVFVILFICECVCMWACVLVLFKQIRVYDDACEMITASFLFYT